MDHHQPQKIFGIQLNELQLLYKKSDGNMDEFFEKIQKKMSNLYMNLSKDVLEDMNEMKLTTKESKIIISEEILFSSLNFLKIIGINTNYNYDPSVIKKFNNLQIAMIGYMKMTNEICALHTLYLAWCCWRRNRHQCC